MATTGTVSTAQQRRFNIRPGTGPVFYGATTLLLIIAYMDTIVIANQLQANSNVVPFNDTGICKSVDIRNTLDAFRRLEGCRVVEGFVQILLFDNVNETLLSRISFPELTEITDYLLLYRVNGLRSIGQLFPNLAVIRGHNTFFTFSFVVFEMSSLQEINLYSLTDITHGLIRIDKNPSLCFVNSIDWRLIAHEDGEHFIKNLKPENECPICPGDEKIREDDYSNSLSTQTCPKGSYRTSSDTFATRHLCWNRQHCQKICPKNCTSCNANGDCCNDNCLGGCAINDTNACTVCKNLTIGYGKNRKCMTQCPDNYYQFLERRCITFNQCMRMRRPIEAHNSGEYPYKIHQKSCVLHCPTNYMSEGRTCKPCEGRCEKECPGVNVDSISLAKQLRGCTNITGSLEIQIRGGRNVVNELEENLSMIEEIRGYLKVVRSFPLISLNFLKNLKRIRGENLESQKYVLVVLDNQNLQDLWDWENRTLQIDNGRLFFHFNPKLCLKKIEMLQKIAHLDNFTDLEVASNSNGDKIACDVENLEVTVSSIESRGVVLEWEQFQMEDQRKLLGYIVYLIETPHRNVTLYDGRDACGGDGWRVDDVAIPDEEKKITHPLVSLKPYTQYAFFVKTYTIATERRGAQSAIKYFRTLPSMPSVPQYLQVTSNSSDSLKMKWLPPAQPNGNVTYYIVAGKKHKIGYSDLNERDYCNSPASPAHKPIISQNMPTTPQIINTNNDSCSCDERKPISSGIDENEEISRINFEDELQNRVYVKKESFESRRKRSVTLPKPFPNDTETDNQTYNNNKNDIRNATENATLIWESFSFKVYGKTEFYINNLHHYTFYDIYVQACREKEGPNDKDDCSSTSIITARTQAKKGADDIKKVTITNQSLDTVSITWEEPSDPNGMIASYSIIYTRLDNENSKPTTECVTRSHFLNQSRIHVLKKLSPGNYSLKVFATSTVGDNGRPSPYVYFHIQEHASSTGLIVGVILIVFILLVVFAGYCFYRKQKADRESMRLIPSINPEYVPSVYVPDEWEVPRRKIELVKELGQGSFGMVYEGIAKDINGKSQIRCAIKTVNEHATARERLEFLNEASVMKAFDTTHVVRLLGVVSQGQPTLVIMELMANGDLKSYLRSHRPDKEDFNPSTARQPPTLRQILQMAIEIADGMAYLSAKKFVHRDLAARNCMVSENLTVKIGDFGMTRDIYETDYYRKGTKGLLPVRWMAPESLKDGLFTSNSDVWSYGVVLWEMATLASQPYQGLSNDQVLRYVIDGGIMERPENCPDKLYNLMRRCWNHKPKARPTFLQLCHWLLEDACPNFDKVSFYHSPAGIEARNVRPTPSPSQDDPTTPLRTTDDINDEFTLSDESDEELANKVGTNTNFSNIPVDNKDGVANGFVGRRTGNDAATTQC